MAKQLYINRSPLFSIIIIVKNDQGIANSLQALEPIVATRPDVEVIVVDASTPGRLQYIRDRFSWVRWEYFTSPTNKQITIPEQRNTGIAAARGDYIIFLDANCVPAKNWLAAMEDGLVHEGHAAVTGPIRSIGNNTWHDAGYTRFTDGQPITECGAANLGVHRRVLEAVGGFDTTLSYGEDVDLAWRIRDAGYDIIWKGEAAIAHDWGGFREEIRRAYRYGTSRTTLYKKHPHRWKGLLTHDSNMLVYPGYMLLLPLAIWFPYYLLLLAVPLLKNRNNSAFKKTFLHFVYGTGALKGIFRSV